jgi:hypothetical protein
MPGVSDLDKLSPFLREFGPILCVLFVVLSFLLTLVSYIVIQQARKIDRIEATLIRIDATLADHGKDVEAIANNLAIEAGVVRAIHDRIRDIFDYFMRRDRGDDSAAKSTAGSNRPPQGG